MCLTDCGLTFSCISDKKKKPMDFNQKSLSHFHIIKSTESRGEFHWSFVEQNHTRSKINLGKNVCTKLPNDRKWYTISWYSKSWSQHTVETGQHKILYYPLRTTKNKTRHISSIQVLLYAANINTFLIKCSPMKALYISRVNLPAFYCQVTENKIFVLKNPTKKFNWEQRKQCTDLKKTKFA